MTEQFIKDLDLIKWNIENRDKEVALQVVGIVAKRYNGSNKIADIVDPASVNSCDSCQ